MHTETTVWLDGVTPDIALPRILRVGSLALVLPAIPEVRAELALALIECLNELRTAALREIVLRDAEWAAALPFDAPDPIDLAKAAADRAEEDGPDDAHNPYLADGGAGDSGYRSSMADAGLSAKVRS